MVLAAYDWVISALSAVLSTRVGRGRQFGEVSCTECTGQVNDFELIPTPVEDYFGTEFLSIYNNCAVMLAYKSQDVKNVCVLLGNLSLEYFIAAHFEQRRSNAQKASIKKTDNEKLWSHDLTTLWRRQRAAALLTDPHPNCVCVLMGRRCQFVSERMTARRQGQRGHNPATGQHKCRYSSTVGQSANPAEGAERAAASAADRTD